MRLLGPCLLDAALALVPLPAALTQPAPSEAPPACDSQQRLITNGFEDQVSFDADRGNFEQVEQRPDGLGPVYNAQSCSECHQTPVSGAISQITELRAGHFDGVNFIDHPGGSLINDRAINPDFQERVLGGNEVRTFRTSLNTLGDGFVEAIDSNTLVAISSAQPFGMQGQLIQVPVLQAGGLARGGRFGRKNQPAGPLSLPAAACLNETGIPNRVFPLHTTSHGPGAHASAP